MDNRRQGIHGSLSLLAAGAALLAGLPLVGVLAAGHDLRPYLHLPPLPPNVLQPPFSWPVFLGLTALLAIVLLPPARRLAHALRHTPLPPPASSFPGWGWAGVALTATAWLLAWNRYSWFAPWQAYTFFPLWLGFILTVNGLCQWRHGSCLLGKAPSLFARLFLYSIPFWWFFEYLNRFVGNWRYVGVEDFSPLGYALHASLCFATVLPAVASVADLLAGFTSLWRPFTGQRALPLHRRSGVLILAPACLGLLLIGRYPAYAFPLLWIAPGLVFLGLQLLAGQPSALAPLARGDYRPVVLWPLAALTCGFFWEMWNARSLAHWEYAVPFVDRFHLFYMPLIGYAGYLPFGVECLVAVNLARQASAREAGPEAAANGKSRKLAASR